MKRIFALALAGAFIAAWSGCDTGATGNGGESGGAAAEENGTSAVMGDQSNAVVSDDATDSEEADVEPTGMTLVSLNVPNMV